MKAKKLGVRAVDSGTLMIGDPCYFITENPPHGNGGHALVVVTAGNPLHIPDCEVL